MATRASTTRTKDAQTKKSSYLRRQPFAVKCNSNTVLKILNYKLFTNYTFAYNFHRLFCAWRCEDRKLIPCRVFLVSARENDTRFLSFGRRSRGPLVTGLLICLFCLTTSFPLRHWGLYVLWCRGLSFHYGLVTKRNYFLRFKRYAESIIWKVICGCLSFWFLTLVF